MPFSACVTEAELIVALESVEVLELSRLTDPLATTIDSVKVQYALDRATDFINSYYLMSNDCGKAYIKTVCKQVTIWITRYFMDSTKSRPFVEEDYTRAMELLKYACTECVKRCPLTQQQIDDLLGEDATSSILKCYSGCGGLNGKNIVRRVDFYGVSDLS